MAKLMIATQVYENYGSSDQPYWKAKGGTDYVVRNFTAFNDLAETIADIRESIEASDDFYVESIVNWFVADDDYLTEFERSQLEYDGRIIYPAQELVLEELRHA